MMKNKLVCAVLAVLAFCLGITGCASSPGIEISPDSTPTQIEGTWKSNHPDAQNATFIFTGNQFVYTRTGFNKSGFIQYTNSELNLVVDGKIVRTYPYVVEDAVLKLSQGSGQGQYYYYGWYEKQ